MGMPLTTAAEEVPGLEVGEGVPCVGRKENCWPAAMPF